MELRESIAAGRTVVGTFAKLGGLEAIDCLARSGLDFAVVDLEHSQLDEHGARTQLAYARALGFPCLVRIPEVDAGVVGRLLEAGARGIQLAGVRARAEVEALVRAARFPPAGDRGVSTTVRDADYGRVPVADYLDGSTARPLLVVQIESARTREPLTDVLAAGIDVCFVGVVDLSVSLGVPGDVRGAAVAGRVAEVAAAATDAGVAFGHHLVGGLAPVTGARYLTTGTDLSVLATGLERLAAEARAAVA